MPEHTDQWYELAQQLRVDSIRSSSAAGSGHPTSSLSAADLMAVLMTKYLHYDFDDPENPANDHLIFSKGHASPLLYAMYRAAGAVTDEEMMSFRNFGSMLQGHPTPAIPWVDVATGSLGQGLPIGVGIALAGKYLDRLPYRIWVLCGDSEMAEGSMWEAFDKAGFYKLHNLIAILDMNRLGQRGPTELGWDSEAYAARATAFGWYPIAIDGHDLSEIDRAYADALEPRERPALIIAHTLKGRGVSFLEDKPGWHGKSLDPEQERQAMAELGGERSITVQVPKPEPMTPAPKPKIGPLALPTYEVGTKIATRQAYGEALKALGGARADVIVLDGEVGNSTYSDIFAHAYPDRFFEMFIAEQQMVAAAVGLNVRHYVPFAATFAAFLSRAYDFIRMAAVSQANIRLCGSHAGVSIGEDGPSQMGLEDIAMMRAVSGSTVLYPSDPNQTAQLVAAMADQPGISFLRTTRAKTPALYPANERFTIGGSKVLRQSDADQVTVIAAGITLHEALKACDELEGEGIAVRLIDLYSVKPIDRESVHAAARATGGRMVVVEDHWPQGGLGEAVLESFTVDADGGVARDGGDATIPLRLIHLAVSGMPQSGPPETLLDAAGISARQIANAVRELLEPDM
ncbi:MAG: transketolase [Ardenticatenaceae bacterium]|nr:transketolase [Ardenticatenaceae bacterium]